MKNIVLLISCFISFSLAAQDGRKPEAYMVGKYEVYILSEGSGEGNTGILIDAPQDVLSEYVPDGAFPIATNAVLVRDGNKVWLIDTGYGRNIFDQMEAVGVSPEGVHYIILTHLHGDHIGGMLRDGEKTFPNALVAVSRKEYDYWTSDEEMHRLPENRRGNFLPAREVLEKYEAKLDILDENIIGSVTDENPRAGFLRAYGHTPGHVMFLIKDGGEQLLIWGDLTHAMAVQMPRPEISVTYDHDPDMARKSRQEVLGYASANKIPVTGMHLPAPKIGTVVEKHGGGYDFIPVGLRK